jgi:hypothetical protein
MWLADTLVAKNALEKKRLAIQLTIATWSEITTFCGLQA